MKYNRQAGIIISPFILFSLLLFGCGGQTDSEYLKDDSGYALTGDYIGQPPPEEKPEIFAPGIVNTGMYTRDLTMTPDGNEIYWSVNVGRFSYAAVLFTERIGGRWTRPRVAPFSADISFRVAEPFISPDGSRMYFVSDAAHSGAEKGNYDIWVMDRDGRTWCSPCRVGRSANTEKNEYHPTAARSGNLYFCRAEPESGIHYIYRSMLVDGHYQPAEKLPEQVNCGRSMFNATISPDEDFIIVPVFGKEGGLGGVDYYIVFRSEDDSWSSPVNMGEMINSPGSQEYSASLSPDGRYLFFMSARTESGERAESYRQMLENMKKPDTGNPAKYWVRADFIDELRERAEEAADE